MIAVTTTIVEDDKSMSSTTAIVESGGTTREKELAESIVKQVTDIIEKYHAGLSESEDIKETIVFKRDL